LGTHVLNFFSRVASLDNLDPQKLRLDIELISDLRLAKYGRCYVEACWLAGEKRPLTTREIAQLGLLRTESHRRQRANAAVPLGYGALQAPGQVQQQKYDED
jgi:hypothetical protein